MSDLKVKIVKSTDGWNIIDVADQSCIAGPFETKEFALEIASDLGAIVHLDVPVILPFHGGKLIKDLEIGTLFRIKSDWYYYNSKDGKNAVLGIVSSAKQTTTLPLKTKIDAVSVLNLK